MDNCDVTIFSVAELVEAYKNRTLSPVEVTKHYFDRIKRYDGKLHSYVELTRDIAIKQAIEAEHGYANGDYASLGKLAGIPVAIKDAFHVAGVQTTLGSEVYKGQIARDDSGLVRRLRASGAVFLGKTNTAEFGQSATTDNLLGSDTANPWDITRTTGGSSGGSAAAVAARLAAVAVGSDGGGSIRIPAAFVGIFGFKPSPGVCRDENGFRGMSEFVSAGPMTRSVEDARTLLSVLADRNFLKGSSKGALKICFCPTPENHPVDPEVATIVGRAAGVLESLGHSVEIDHPPIEGWEEIFGPLVLEEEHRERGHLLTLSPEKLTRYERSSLEAALAIAPAEVQRARELLPIYRRRLNDYFDKFDIVVTPTTAVLPFTLGKRPQTINGREVNWLWGAFPFTAPFNVGGVAASTVPCGLVNNLPVSVQLVSKAGSEQLLLDISQELEEAIVFDNSGLRAMWD